MKALLTAVLLVTTMAIATAAAAQDAPKVKKPTLCTSGTPVAGERFVGFLCTDGKRPKLFTRYIEVNFVDADGKAASYVLGWVGAPVKPVKLPARVPADTKRDPAKRVDLVTL